jgi:N-acetylated-alpha-linked acidic dipeptidase
LPITYRVGGEHPIVKMRVTSDDAVRPIWTVTGSIRGREHPDDLVIVGNHRDAWIYGGVDPSSGSAALMELARTLGELRRSGWQPRRTIVFASWDAEEFTLTSSTEWGEQHEEVLRGHAVAYLNVDSASSGPNFTATAVPALNRVIGDAARTVRDPVRRITIAAASRDRLSRERGVLPTGSTTELVDNRLGSGSDYTVFLNFLGVPVADLSFDGPYGVYHSIYDNHNWVARIGDPGFRYHGALVRLWGVVALRLTEADALPLDYEPYAERIEEFAKELERRWPAGVPGLAGVSAAAAEMRSAAQSFNQRRTVALAKGDRTALDQLNGRLLAVERALLSPEGIPGRPWYRHLVYAPRFTYAPELLPGVAEAMDAEDRERAGRQADVLEKAVRRAAELLR